ncbi:MAG: M1 family metallopeptidase, partial [Flavobacteriia bacterium]|nr:M1 family metallopeptidase [Flavobacteriia bacterium]
MKLLLSSIFLTFFITSFFAQNYWQQEVNYKIDVKLDDSKHEITAVEEFEYVNNSPNKLDFIYIHLWPNAYKNEKTGLGQQLWKSGKTILKFGADSLKGNISGIDFKVNGEKATWEIDANNIDICRIILKTPLLPGERLIVSTPFIVKIPSGEISRLGHVGQSYQITQWYPKPAVYDKNGWNPIPYLNQGEFYSEYGSFDVTITLPKNYIVGATGDLQTESEIAYLNEKAIKTAKKFENNEFVDRKKADMSFPSSSSEFKTLRYMQHNVHDFAWFADKRFEVLKGEVIMPASKRKVITWAMFTPKNANVWKNSIEYINDGTYYYSLWNGDYPYSQVTAVDGTISAGGGMEYPNVTVIGNTSNKEELEVVIVHEVGHNWFYGILGSNERVHGWMDEGMNTLNEVRYIQTKYPENTRMSDMVLNGKFHLDHLNHHDLSDISYRFMAIIGEDQPIETHSADFTSANYGAIMYMKTGLVMFYLKDYLGEDLFGKCQHAYFETWKFKHPQPEDMKASFEKIAGKDLSWLFNDLIQTTNHIDYKIVSVEKEENTTVVKVKNSGQVNGPISVSAFNKGAFVETKWVEPGADVRIVTFNSSEIDEVKIDGNKNIPEITRANKTKKKSQLFNKIEPLKFE